MTPLEKKIKRTPWKYCKECKCEIKSPTGYCHEHWRGDRWTAQPYGLGNAPAEFKFTPSEGRMK
jgi:hypothetical protein